MNRFIPTLALGFLVVFTACQKQEAADSGQAGSTDLKSNYLGQKPPGLKPVLFAPEVVCTDGNRERDVSFSPDMKEFYFTRNATIMVMKQVDGGWTEAQPAPFSTDVSEFEAYVALDNKRLYYISQRSVEGDTVPGAYQLWFVDRNGADWGKPQMLTDQGDFYPTMTTDGFLYFTDSHNDLYRTKLVDGAVTEREKLSDSINTARDEYNACVSPDGSFIIFTSNGWGAGFGGGDLFISYRKEDGSWSRAKNMGGGINSNGLEYCPAISPDGNHLFFASNKRGRDDIYWVDAAIIEYLKTHDLNIADSLFETVMKEGPGACESGYADLKTRFAEYCVFDGGLLTSVGDRLLGAGKTAEAVEIMKLNAMLYPRTQTAAQAVKLAVVSNDGILFDAISKQMKSTSASLTGRDEAQLNVLGYRLIGWKNMSGATKVFKLNVELFPSSSNVYDSYGEILLANGDTTASIVNYKRSLELDPENTNASDVLEKIQGK